MSTVPPARSSAAGAEAPKAEASKAEISKACGPMPGGADFAQGRICQGPPIATIDIGSNSVRLVVYEGLTRSPTPIFNEKVLCGLGRGVAVTRRLDPEAVAKAYAALQRFRALCDTMGVKELYVLATAAARDAEDGDAFIARAREICRNDIELLSGKREARLSAYGVISGFHMPDGVVGDMGGGSLELIDVHGHRAGSGVTTPLGGLALQDASGLSVRKAAKLAQAKLEKAEPLKGLKNRTFYAVGGTWRSLAKLHMMQMGYPLHIMHGYSMPAREMLDFCRLIMRVDNTTLIGNETVSAGRLPLLAYGAAVMSEIIKVGKPADVVISALGVREGLLYSLLDEETRKLDPLIAAARELNVLRSRSPQHGEDLLRWSDRFMSTSGIDETSDERRQRHAACLLADTGWRAHPDYRGEQSLNVIANAAFVGIDHRGRVFMAVANFFRHVGLNDEELSPRIREIATTRILDRARILGGLMRVGYVLSASMPQVLPRCPLYVSHGKLMLDVPRDLEGLVGERLAGRMKALARLIGREPFLRIVDRVEAAAE
ncbi:Ppx/GppA family phosphatase [Labrys monachus]|uniref:Exopolyphosphatase/guanosine-5'-triphosphate, 3'-diphosphate pyrophosphatase n=1 Tax=Labrys monachus TaxID=217067 RepID=A0ABU0FKL1_9HYPH|nr:Ppx/GppA phosphatase family protein [Labrys monachus]MDQ0395135.1 exopolyphosphatase/guanosine-5'-triphosphate,3'-diphosphate pyrophosphatase [Labrys monachus]